MLAAEPGGRAAVRQLPHYLALSVAMTKYLWWIMGRSLVLMRPHGRPPRHRSVVRVLLGICFGVEMVQPLDRIHLHPEMCLLHMQFRPASPVQTTNGHQHLFPCPLGRAEHCGLFLFGDRWSGVWLCWV